LVWRRRRGRENRLVQAEEMSAKRSRDLQAVVHEPQLILDKERVALLRHINVGVVRGVWLNRGILKILAFELVTTRDEICPARAQIETRAERVDASIKIRS